jgi:hypothetical protein
LSRQQAPSADNRDKRASPYGSNVFNMTRITVCVLLLVLLACFDSLGASAPSPNWLDRAPLNTDTDIVGLPWYGLGKAYRFLAVLLNWAVLAGTCYGLGKHEMEWSNFVYVYVGIVVASFLLSTFLNPLLHIFTLIPIIALATFLLARFCLLSPARALTATLLYQLYQIGYLLAYKAIAASYA